MLKYALTRRKYCFFWLDSIWYYSLFVGYSNQAIRRLFENVWHDVTFNCEAHSLCVGIFFVFFLSLFSVVIVESVELCRSFGCSDNLSVCLIHLYYCTTYRRI